jgi:hypothetical protein
MRFWRTVVGQMSAGMRSSGWRRRLTRPHGWAVAAVAGILVLAVAGSVTGALAVSGGPGGHPSPSPSKSAAHGPATAAKAAGAGSRSKRARTAHHAQTHPAQAHHARAHRPAQAADHRGELRTSCRSVAHVGDSTSVDLITPQYLPNQAQQLPAQYTDVGVRHLHMDASGGRSIVEELPGQLNGYVVAQRWWDEGFRGCWVFALGTNDAANVAVGDSPGFMARIERMMSVAHGEPVLWVNTKTLLGTGPWAEANEEAWDRDLVRALAMYPNMRILNWDGMAQPSWFLPDGIHYNSVGCPIRAEAIAHALARAFPKYGASPSQIVY